MDKMAERIDEDRERIMGERDGAGEGRKRIRCYYLTPEQWYLETGMQSDYGGTACCCA